jgi:NTF2 fold immunity protein of polymorphic toxin system component
MIARRKQIVLSTSRGAIALIGCVFVSGLLLAGGSSEEKPGYTPKAGFVPDEKTALSIAISVLTPVYGEKALQSEEPFTARLEGDAWFVQGHLPEGHDGGVAEVKISKSKGCILWMYHGK